MWTKMTVKFVRLFVLAVFTSHAKSLMFPMNKFSGYTAAATANVVFSSQTEAK